MHNSYFLYNFAAQKDKNIKICIEVRLVESFVSLMQVVL